MYVHQIDFDIKVNGNIGHSHLQNVSDQFSINPNFYSKLDVCLSNSLEDIREVTDS